MEKYYIATASSPGPSPQGRGLGTRLVLLGLLYIGLHTTEHVHVVTKGSSFYFCREV